MTHNRNKPAKSRPPARQNRSTKQILKNIPDEDILVEAAVRQGESLSKLQTPDYYIPSAQELKDWKEAVALACAWIRPRRYLLNILYKNLTNDSHTLSVMESRILRVLRSKFRLVNDKTGVENEDLTKLLQKPWFEKFIRLAISAVFYGTTVIEVFEQTEDGQVKTVTGIPRGFVLPETGEILKNYYDNEGWKYREPPYSAYYIQAGETDDIGLFAKVAPMIIAKKFAVGAWSHYTEKFGIPFRWITTDSTDNARIKTLNTILSMMAGSGHGVFNSTEKLEVQQTDSSQKDVFKDFISVLNSEISKAILGQDGTTDHKDSPGTFGSLKVLQGVANDRHEADKMMIKNVVNMDLLPRLIDSFGYPIKGHHFDWSKTEDLEIGNFIQAVKDLSVDYELDIDQITEKTGINILGVKQNPGPIGAPPTAQKKNFRRLNLNLPLSAEFHLDHSPQALDESQLRSIEDEILHSVFHDEQLFSPEYYRYLSGELNKALEAGWKKIPMEYSSIDQSVQTMMEASIYRFSAAKDMAMLQQLNELVRQSGTFDDFKVKAAEILGSYDGDYLRAEYNNAIAAGQNAARYRDQLANIEDLPYWQYQTAGDDRVREEHRILDGLILKADDPAWSKIYPPNGWGCRCEVIPLGDLPRGMEVVDGDVPINLLQTTGLDKNGLSEFDRMKRDGFAINRGDLAQVFTENQNYIRQFNAKFTPEDMYGSDKYSFDKLKEEGLPSRVPTLKGDHAAKQWYESLKGDDGIVTFADNQSRDVQLSESTFKRNLDAGIVEFIPTVLSDPDEIWLTGKGGQAGITKTFVKFYDEDMIMIYVDAYTDHPMFVKSYGTGDDKKRTGLLIKRYKK